jgi:hypothetical protein
MMALPSEIDRVRSLVREGKLASDEGERILAAMEKRTERAWPWLLLDPFDRFGGATGIVIGVAASLASVALSRVGVIYDGFLDTHQTKTIPSLTRATLCVVVAWPLMAVALWGISQLLKRGSRLVDFLAMLALARLPLLLVAPFALLVGRMVDVEHPAATSPLVALVALPILALVGWNVTLLYRGFKHASGLAGPKLVVSFIASMVACEIVSKLIIGALS